MHIRSLPPCGLCTTAVLLALVSTSAAARGEEHRAEWLAEARFGVMTHYLADWIARRDDSRMDVDRWNRLIDEFQVERLAEQLDSVGARYYVITIGQNSGYYLAPNAVYDKFVGRSPSRCSRRDLVADLHAALEPRGIRLMVYLPAGAPGGDDVAVKALEWSRGPHRNHEFQIKWEEVIRHWSERWGDHVSGWWFDGCYWPNSMYRHVDSPNFASFAASAWAGNPRSILAFNPGVYPRIHSIAPEEDYIAGEINDPAGVDIRRPEGGRLDGAQIHVLTYLGKTWGEGPPRFDDRELVEFSKNIWRREGAITWDAPLETDGTFEEDVLKQLRAVGAAVRQ